MFGWHLCCGKDMVVKWETVCKIRNREACQIRVKQGLVLVLPCEKCLCIKLTHNHWDDKHPGSKHFWTWGMLTRLCNKESKLDYDRCFWCFVKGWERIILVNESLTLLSSNIIRSLCLCLKALCEVWTGRYMCTSLFKLCWTVYALFRLASSQKLLHWFLGV